MPEGKAAVDLNAVNYGLLSQEVLILEEDKASEGVGRGPKDQIATRRRTVESLLVERINGAE